MALILCVNCVTGFFFCLPTYDLSSKSLISALNILFIKYSQSVEIICDAHATFRSIATNNPWPTCEIRLRFGNEQFSNYLESSIRVFKSFKTLLNEGNLFSTELLGRIDVITSIMNAYQTCLKR